ncbi:MAG TPA: triose-phosphate isomerase family protein [Candidatus Paceibacterota bacterium]|jgi:triosephosphate isomerase|nr:triose-phosphate isomerase family protein [Candidatus Paceibacterota bacterium]
MLYLIGNWKMAPEKNSQVIDLVKKTTAIARTYKKSLTTIICPPAVFLPAVVKNAKVPLLVGAQGLAASDAIAQTGLISAGMLKDNGAAYCIIGHSEMRARGDNNEIVKQQLTKLFDKKIVPILCIGEKTRDTQGWYLSEIKEQLETAFADLVPLQAKKIIIAYEPVWAIGKDATRAATPAECREMMIFIRKMLSDKYDEKIAKSIVLLYGGSADEFNARSFVTDGAAQGFLVGRVSLEAKRLEALAKAITTPEK